MKLLQNLTKSVLAVGTTVGVSLLIGVSSALASPGLITGNTAGSRVNIRTEPSIYSSAPSYGLVGDSVEILSSSPSWEQDGYTWYEVRLPRSGAVGWIRGDHIQAFGGGSSQTGISMSEARQTCRAHATDNYGPVELLSSSNASSSYYVEFSTRSTQTGGCYVNKQQGYIESIRLYE